MKCRKCDTETTALIDGLCQLCFVTSTYPRECEPLTLRDRFAMAALNSLPIVESCQRSYSTPSLCLREGDPDPYEFEINDDFIKEHCMLAYKYADAMIEARKQNEKGDES